MATERTLSIIKPDATRRNLTGQINARFEILYLPGGILFFVCLVILEIY